MPCHKDIHNAGAGAVTGRGILRSADWVAEDLRTPGDADFPLAIFETEQLTQEQNLAGLSAIYPELMRTKCRRSTPGSPVYRRGPRLPSMGGKKKAYTTATSSPLDNEVAWK
jgi:hypothetical protein